MPSEPTVEGFADWIGGLLEDCDSMLFIDFEEYPHEATLGEYILEQYKKSL